MSLQSTWKRRKKVALVTFVRLFTKMSFQMNSQMACLLFPFSIVSCQMFSQIACSRGCKNTLVTFVRLFSIVIVKFFSSLTQISICIFNFHCSICQIYTQQTNKCTKWTQNTIKVPHKKCDTKKGYHQYPIVYPIIQTRGSYSVFEQIQWKVNVVKMNRGERIVFWWPNTNTNIIRFPKNDRIRILFTNANNVILHFWSKKFEVAFGNAQWENDRQMQPL